MMGKGIMYLRLKENYSIKNWLMVAIIILVLIVGSGCSLQSGLKAEGDDLGTKLHEVHNGAKRFSKLRNGTIEINSTMKTEDNSSTPLVNGSTEGTSLVTFISKPKGYDYLEEKKDIDDNTGKVEYSANKVVSDHFYISFHDEEGVDQIKPYDWQDFSKDDQHYYEPGIFVSMTGQGKLLKNREYINTITKEEDGHLTKYTLTTNDTYADYVKKVHAPEENYMVLKHVDIYWINKDGLLVKQRTIDKMKWTLQGEEDTYILDMTMKLTGHNYKNLKTIGNELLPMIMFDGKLYVKSDAIIDVNQDALVQVGTIDKVIGSSQKPEQDNQANRLIKGAKIYESSEKALIVKDVDYVLYERE